MQIDSQKKKQNVENKIYNKTSIDKKIIKWINKSIYINAEIYIYRKYIFVKNIINIKYMYIYILLSIQCHLKSFVHASKKQNNACHAIVMEKLKYT